MFKKRQKRRANIALCIIAALFLLPTIWLLFAALDQNPTVAVRFPRMTLNNFRLVLSRENNLISFKNSLVMSLGVSLIAVCLSALAAYALSRYPLPHKKLFMLAMLLMTSLPLSIAMVPVYKAFVSLKLIDSLLGVILFMSATSMPYSIWMMKNFMDSVSIEYEEAAWIDGADKFKSFLHVVLPLLVPGLITIFIYVFSSAWGSFFVPFILLSTSSKYPASVNLYQFMGQHDVQYGLLSAYSICYTFPTIVLYVLGQKFMSKGFTMQGGIKG